MICTRLAGENLALMFILGLGFVMCALAQNFPLVCLRGARHSRDPFHKLGLKQNVGVGEHAVFQ